MTDLFDLGGKVALVTGGSRGLGLVIAGGLARSGARIVLNGRNGERLDRAVSGLRAAGLAAEGAAFDVRDAASIDAGIGRIEKDAGAVDILVNNAGIQSRAPLAAMSEEQWRAVMDTNLTGAFLVARRVVPAMMARKRGKIINICSLMSEVARPTTANYAAAKGGLKMLTRAMAVEWAGCNIQANGIAPGYFDTEMTRALVEDKAFNACICRRTPAGRWGRPEELIGAAVFLSSEASDFVNGQILFVDGGFLAGV